MKRILVLALCALGLAMAVGQIFVASTETASLSAQESSLQKEKPPDAAGQPPQAATAPSYAEVAAIIAKYNCTVCHGGAEPRAGLSLDDYKTMMKGSKRGMVIVSGDPANSELARRLKGTSEPRMPYTGPPWLSDAEVETIERWIGAGAPGHK